MPPIATKHGYKSLLLLHNIPYAGTMAVWWQNPNQSTIWRTRETFFLARIGA